MADCGCVSRGARWVGVSSSLSTGQRWIRVHRAGADLMRSSTHTPLRHSLSDSGTSKSSEASTVSESGGYVARP